MGGGGLRFRGGWFRVRVLEFGVLGFWGSRLLGVGA